MENGKDPAVAENSSEINGHVEKDLSSSVRESSRKRKPTTSAFFIGDNPTKRTAPKPKADKKKDTEAEFESDWICSECKEAECLMKADAEQLLVCEGPCRRLFHYPCAGLPALPPEDEDYTCSDCIKGRHACAICQQYGEDNLEVFHCSKPQCGLFFHESCLAMQNVEVQQSATMNEDNDESGESKGPTAPPRFTCPAHCCWTCTQKDLKKQEQDAEKVTDPTQKKTKKKKKASKRNSAFESKTERRLIVSLSSSFFLQTRSLLDLTTFPTAMH